MKFLLLTLGLTVLLSERSIAGEKRIKASKVWEVSQGLAQPESTFYHAGTDTIYVSNVAGEPLKKDKTGWISTLSPEGKVTAEKWCDGLDAPKGMAESKGILWVSDIDRVVGIDIKTGKVKETVTIPGAKFLNDVAAAADGSIFVSDTSGNAIYKVKDGKSEVFKSGADLEAPNGLLIYYNHNRLLVAGWGTGVDDSLGTTGPGSLIAIDLKTKKRQSLSTPRGHLDGLELSWKGLDGFLVSDWVAGTVYVVHKSTWTPIVEGLKGAADIGTMPAKKILLVPEMGASKVHAYTVSRI